MESALEGRGPVRYGPPVPEPGLPVLPELAAVLADAAASPHAEPPGGGPALLDAARGYWARRGLAADPALLAAAPGAPALLLALTAAIGGDVLLPRPCPAWWAPQARLLGRPTFTVTSPAACGGVPDPYALLETVRRVRAEGGDPRLLVLAVADDPTGTVVPPEVMSRAVEAAAAEGLHVVSDETWRDTVYRPEETTVVGPAEMLPDGVTVISDLSGGWLPPGWPAAVVRFPDTATGAQLRARCLDILTALDAALPTPVAAAAAHALAEPPELTARLARAVALHGRLATALHTTLRTAGALVRPPQAGRHLYADLSPLAPGLAAHGVTDALELENDLTARLGMPAPGGHRFGDDLAGLRVRLSTGPLLGDDETLRAGLLTGAPDPLQAAPVRRALDRVAEVLGALAAPPPAGAEEAP
ncbi:aminotransferase class I/II-fold pyridoxal phosphate-dependent enzyme [Streptomyces sp. NPDC058372]|uniref:aminotransferase class I/II-fold pyridoxal phosphate-dependent enzyme n=1 Tax=unclassified Streptomyces TaxID=2593676 RepID=UPI003646C771